MRVRSYAKYFLAEWAIQLLGFKFELPEHLSSPPVFSGVRVTRSLVVNVCFVDHCLSFILFLLAIVLSVLLPYTDSDYPFIVFSNSSCPLHPCISPEQDKVGTFVKDFTYIFCNVPQIIFGHVISEEIFSTFFHLTINGFQIF